MGPYRDRDIEAIVRQLGIATQDVLDAKALEEKARLAWKEAERRRGEAQCRLAQAEEAYEKARWP